MTKAEMIARIASQTGVEKTAALAVVEAFMENVKESMIGKYPFYYIFFRGIRKYMG